MDYVDTSLDECIFRMFKLKGRATRGLSSQVTKTVSMFMGPITTNLYHLTFNKLNEVDDGRFKAEYAILRLANIAMSSMSRRDNFICGKEGTLEREIIEPLAEKISVILVNTSVNIAEKYTIDMEELLDTNLLNIQKQ